MRVTRLVVLAVLLCTVMQIVSSRQLKFKTFGDGMIGGGGATGPTPTPAPFTDRPPTNTGSGGFTPSPTPKLGDGTFTPRPTSAPSVVEGAIDACSTLSCKLNVTRTESGGTGTIVTPGSIYNLTKLLTNYTEDDENMTRTDITVATTDYQRKIESTQGAEAFFTGESGLMKLQSSDASNYLSIKFRKLADSDGQRALNFENATWTWEGPTTTTRNGLEASVITATGSVTIETLKGTTAEASFYVEVLTFNVSGSFPYGNETLKVSPLSAKISYNISGWPFYNDSGSFLYLAVTINSNKNGLSTDAAGDGVRLGSGKVSAPSTAYVDDEAQNVDLFYSTDLDDASGCQARLLMVFPQFAERLYYDPILTPDEAAAVGPTETPSPTESTTTTKKAALGYSFSVITALLAVLLMLALNL